MTKKTIIFGVIALAVLAGLIWYGSQRDLVSGEQASSLLKMNPFSKEESPQLVEEEFVLGDPGAPVTIIEYSSHFCGHCADFHQETLPLIREKYIKTGQVKFIPRRLSPSELGQTLLCAQEQDKFQLVDDYLFEHIGGLLKQTSQAASEDELEGIVADWLGTAASEAGLEQNSFARCFNSARYQERVKLWFEQAEADGVEGTPTFFINGQKIIGNQPYSVFEEAIEQTLAQ